MATRRDDLQLSSRHLARAILCAALCIAVSILGLSAPNAHADNLQTSITISVCGNGIVDPGEVCDDGYAGNTGLYGSTTAERHCEPGCEAFGLYCGDGVLQVRFGEQCDEGAANGGGGLCSLTCVSLPPVPPATPSQVVGSTPYIPGAVSGNIPSVTQTQVVLRGKAYPNATVHILLDGNEITTSQADSNANFLYNTTTAAPGIATYSFWAADANGTESLTTSYVFDVVQSAITSVNNIFLPPTLALSSRQVAPGTPLTLSGQSVPTAQVITSIDQDTSNSLASNVDSSGNWALQLDTNSLSTGLHIAKESFVLSTTSKSGYGKSMSFVIGTSLPSGCGNPDINGDGKVNLVDFSIFLLSWGTSNPTADFNCDGKVNLADFSILLFNWTG